MATDLTTAWQLRVSSIEALADAVPAKIKHIHRVGLGRGRTTPAHQNQRDARGALLRQVAAALRIVDPPLRTTSPVVASVTPPR